MTITFPTGADILSDAQQLIGEVDGPQVQLYSESINYVLLNKTFNMVFTKFPWEPYCRWNTVSLAGASGKITTNTFGDVRDTTDFLHIYRDGESKDLGMLTMAENPYRLTGTRVQKWTVLPHNDADYVGKRLQFWPLAATGDLNIKTRLHPGTISAETTLYVDADLLTFGLVWMAIDDEGTNPAGAVRYQRMFDQRYRDLMSVYARNGSEFYTGSGVPSDWFERV